MTPSSQITLVPVGGLPPGSVPSSTSVQSCREADCPQLLGWKGALITGDLGHLLSWTSPGPTLPSESGRSVDSGMPIEMQRFGRLPSLVRNCVERAIPAGVRAPMPIGTRITQRGEMRQRPDAKALKFTAVQSFDVARVAFLWRAHFPIAPGVWLDVVDACEGDEGRLEAKVWGLIPFMRDASEGAARAQALRFLAELPWNPHAILADADIGWLEVGDRSVEASLPIRDSRVLLQMNFGEGGEVESVWTAARPRKVGKTSEETPWGGEFGDYAELGGIRIPTRGAVYWDLPEGRFTYWSGQVLGAELIM